MTKQVEKLIREAASQMPVIYRMTTEMHRVKGQELLDQGSCPMYDAAAFVADRTYTQTMPVLAAINHKRRMVRAFKREGTDGVIKYITYVAYLIKRENKSQVIEGEADADVHPIVKWFKSIF